MKRSLLRHVSFLTWICIVQFVWIATSWGASTGTVASWGTTQIPAVPSGTRFAAVSGSEYHCLGLTSDGRVLSWGWDTDGQRTVPIELTNVFAVASGKFHSVALQFNGKVVAWGASSGAQLNIPAGLTDAVAIDASGYRNIALKGDGTVVTWGRSPFVPSGISNVVAVATGDYHTMALKADGTVISWGESSLSDVPPGISNVVSISAKGSGSLALKQNGLVVAWGDNSFGQLNVPPGLSNVTAIATGGSHNLALKRDGTVMAWGQNNYGQCTVPAGLSNVVAVAAGPYHSMAILSNGELVGWGSNASSQSSPPGAVKDIVAVAAGGYHMMALKSNGRVLAWENNYFGQSTVPVSLTNATAIAAGAYFSLALKSDSTVLGWGENPSGQLTIPLDLTNAIAISAGYGHSMALRNDGSVTAWGLNSSGQTNVPISATNLIGIAAGYYHSLGLRSDGTVIAWGANDRNQCTIPDGLTNVIAISSGEYNNLALKADGTIVGWGNTGSQSVIPPGLTNITAISVGISHSLVLKSDGTVVSWGFALEGETTVPTSYTNVIGIAAGKYFNTVLIGATPFLPPTPTLAVSATRLATKLTLKWTDPFDGEVIYKIDRKIDNGEWAPYVTLFPNAQGFTDLNVSGNTLYTYRVYATFENGSSTNLEEVSAMPIADLRVPTMLTATDVTTGIKLTWADNSTGETNYVVERRSGASQYSTYATLPPNSTNFTDSAVTVGTAYYYRIIALAGNLPSLYSPEIQGIVNIRRMRMVGSPQVGNVTIGDFLQTTLTLSNIGDFPIAVTGITLPEGFSADWSAGVISPQESKVIMVKFAPQRTGSVAGYIFVLSNANAGDYYIQAVGRGVPAPAISVVRQGGNHTFNWSTPVGGFQLEYATGITGNSWTPVSGTPTLSGEKYSLTMPIPEGTIFYRLKK